MTLNKLHAEMTAAMKNKDRFRKTVISGMVDAVKKAAIDKNCRDNIPESLVDEVLLRYKKMIQEMVDTCPTNRVETLANYRHQMEVVNEFAPALITDEAQIKTIVLDFATENNIELTKNNRGKIMSIISKCLKGKVDMGVVSKVVGEMLR